MFKVQPDGSGFAVLKWFTYTVEGTTPVAGLALPTLGGNLRGVSRPENCPFCCKRLERRPDCIEGGRQYV